MPTKQGLKGVTKSNPVLDLLSGLNPLSYPINLVLDTAKDGGQKTLSNWKTMLSGNSSSGYIGAIFPKPSADLYHGTSSTDLENINKTGLAPDTYVTTDPEYAQKAAKVRTRFVGGKPVVLKVPTGVGNWKPVGTADATSFQTTNFIPAKHLNIHSME